MVSEYHIGPWDRARDYVDGDYEVRGSDYEVRDISPLCALRSSSHPILLGVYNEAHGLPAWEPWRIGRPPHPFGGARYVYGPHRASNTPSV